MIKRSTLREIRNSLGRYLAIFAIAALGVAFFTGLKDCKESMLQTCNNYLKKTNFYEYQILTSYGIDDQSVEIAKAFEGVKDAEATIQEDVLVQSDENEVVVYKAISMPKSINMPQLTSGRMPEADDECVIDDYGLRTEVKVGDTIVIDSSNSESTYNSFKYKELKVVGTVSSPLYLDYQRGSTTIGNGSIQSYFYVNQSSFDLDYYTGLYIKLDVADEYFTDSVEKKIDAAEESMKTLAAQINDARRDTAMSAAQEQLDEKKAEYESSLAQFNSKSNYLNSSLSELKSYKQQLESGISQAQAQATQLWNEITAGGLEPEDYINHLTQIYYINNTLIPDLQSKLSQVESGIAQAESAKPQVESGRSQLNSAKEQLDEAQRQIDDMEKGSHYVFTRYENSGFSVFEENSEIVDNIAKIFPVFFLLVAALVCMTTMTRMIDEQRTQIGILKALGYSNAAILSKYMFYSGSATFLGATIGFFGGSKLFPMVIWKAYTMMYSFDSKCVFVLDWKMGVISIGAALLCAIGTTWAACAGDFSVIPAQLIRPKAPSSGKRILLERITPLWSRISFLWKVSLRNIFRYKKRAFMMILGVSGCTALLIAGMGINTTIKGSAEFQYSEVQHDDYMLVFSTNMDEATQAEFKTYAGDDVGEMLFLHMASADVMIDKSSYEISLVCTDAENIRDYMDLHYNGKNVDYPGDGEIVVCEKLRNKYNLKKGDTITLKDGYRKMDVKIANFCDNYVGDYCYVNTNTYRTGFELEPSVKVALVKAPAKADDDTIKEKAAYLAKYESVVACQVNADTKETVDTMMKSLNAIVIVIILCAGLLAFIVLFNLTNINITERIREIATIKVLGFNRREVSNYVFRENLVLTAIAALIGIPIGKWLLDFVISKIVVNSIYFVPKITVADYAISVALTFVFALIVNLAMKKRLNNISMTESLKSIE